MSVMKAKVHDFFQTVESFELLNIINQDKQVSNSIALSSILVPYVATRNYPSI